MGGIVKDIGFADIGKVPLLSHIEERLKCGTKPFPKVLYNSLEQLVGGELKVHF